MTHVLTDGATWQMPWRTRHVDRPPAAQALRRVTHVD